METNRNDLLAEWLLPIPKDRFWQEVYERELLHVLADGRVDRFKSFFSRKDLEEILWLHAGELVNVALVYREAGDRILPKPDLTRDEYTKWIFREYRKGGTVVLNGVRRMSLEIEKTCQDLEWIFQGSVSANAYLTPPSSQGFGRHFDSHDTLILQLEGRKLWRFFNCPEIERLPNSSRTVTDSEVDGDWSVWVNQGDLLYIPRGLAHEATTDAESSLHLTLGLFPLTWRDVLHDLVDEFVGICEEYRASVGPWTSEEARERRFHTIRNELCHFLGRKNSTERHLANARSRLIRRTRLLPCFDLSDETSLGLGDLLVRRAERCELTIEGAKVRLHCPGQQSSQRRSHTSRNSLNRQFVAPSTFVEALEFLVGTNEPFLVGDIPGLPEPLRIALSTQLLEHGFLSRSMRS